jgi:hypothetical protein
LYYTPEEGGKQWLFFHLGQVDIVPQMGISLASTNLAWADSRQIQDERTVDIFTGAGIRARQAKHRRRSPHPVWWGWPVIRGNAADNDHSFQLDSYPDQSPRA